MKKLAVFTLYTEKGASSKYRAYIFREEFNKYFDVAWFSFWDEKYTTIYIHNKKKYFLHILFQFLKSFIKRLYQLLFIVPKYDVLFIQKSIIPKVSFTFLKCAINQSVHIVYDVDDAVYTLPKDNSKKIAKISNCVICGNENLFNFYKKYNKNCIILPTIENTNGFESYWKDTFDKKVIGWIGSQTTIDNFDIIIDALNDIVDRHPEVTVEIISNSALDYTQKIKNSKLILWNEVNYIEKLSNFSIGIMPLKDNEMNRGKCGFKLIQYLTMKKPVIGSDVGVNSQIIKGNGIIANNKEDWICALETLLYNQDRYVSYVSNIEKNFFDSYDFKVVSKKLINSLLMR